MDRIQFERIRDLPRKIIRGDIVLKSKKERSGVYIADDISIENSLGIEARLKIEWREETDAKCINVHVRGLGPICRLDVDSLRHKPCGRSHKHALKTPSCPENNLNIDVLDRKDLSGLDIEAVFKEFCDISHIEHSGTFVIERM